MCAMLVKGALVQLITVALVVPVDLAMPVELAHNIPVGLPAPDKVALAVPARRYNYCVGQGGARPAS